jgi:hypothetical protein
VASLAGLVPTVIDSVIELRVEIRGDVGGMGRTPTLAVYRDGTVLRPFEGPSHYEPRITRLTPAGLARLKEAAAAGGLMEQSGAIQPDPDYMGGFISYVIELRTGDELIRRSTPNALAPTDRPAGEQLIARATELADLDRWLPADAWAIGPADAVPYVAANFLLKLTIWDHPWPGPSDDPFGPRLDVADVAWPLSGKLEDFGDRLAEPPLGEGSAARCGAVTLADAARVQAALLGAPWSDRPIPGSDRMAVLLSWASAGSLVDVSLANLLPDDPLDCGIDMSWP